MQVAVLLVTVVGLLSSGYSAEVQFENVSRDIYENIFIYLMQGPDATNYVKIPLKDGLTLADYSFFDTSRETVFYFHGWTESATVVSVATIANALLERNTTNTAVFDYSALVQEKGTVIGYPESFLNVTHIGNAIGQYLQQYVANNVQQLEFIHLVSHSLGSQIMSKAARTYGSGMLPWLTGLDPAGPLFNLPLIEHLEASDGVFVDVIHTDSGFYGEARTVGTVDFFPNRGTRVQPYCENNVTDFCSHHMSWRFYAESIRRPLEFPAKKCGRTGCDLSLSNLLCTCTSERAYMGYNVDKSAKGTFYLTTNSQPPFGRGQSGLNFGKDTN